MSTETNEDANSELTVFQSNQYTESRQEFSVVEKRIMQYIIAQIKPTDTSFKTYVISVDLFMNIEKKDKSKTYRDIKKIAKTMLGRYFFATNDKSMRFHGFPYFRRVFYAQGRLTINLNDDMHELFVGLIKSKKGFTSYELTEFMSLGSTYAQRIYELLKQYSNHKDKERVIEIDKLKDMLGIDKKKYKKFADLRKRVLEQAYKHITLKTTLSYEWEGVKEGRKYTAIRFFNISSNTTEIPYQKEMDKKNVKEENINDDIDLELIGGW